MLKLPVEGNKYTNYRKGGGEQLSWRGGGGEGGSVKDWREGSRLIILRNKVSIASALWTKRGECGISREARDEGSRIRASLALRAGLALRAKCHVHLAWLIKHLQLTEIQL